MITIDAINEINGEIKYYKYSFANIKHLNEFIAHVDTCYPLEKCVNLIKTMYINKNIKWKL